MLTGLTGTGQLTKLAFRRDVVMLPVSVWRDHGAGLLPDRPGRPAASGFLRGPFAMAWRLQRGVLLAWVAGYLCTFAAFGAATKGFDSVLGTSVTLKSYFLRIGYQATVINAYLSAVMLLAGIGAAAYATSAVLRLRAEETGNLAEPVLATATGRIRWGSATFPSRWAARACCSPRPACRPAWATAS